MIDRKFQLLRFGLSLCLSLYCILVSSQTPFDIKSRTLISKDSIEIAIPPIDSVTQSNTITTDSLAIDSQEDTATSTNIIDSTPVNPPTEFAPPSEPIDSASPPIPITESKEKDAESLTNSSRGLKNLFDTSQIKWVGLEYWAFVLDLILLLLTAGLFVYDREIFEQIRKAAFQENFLRFIYRDVYLRKPYPFIYLNIIYVIGLGYLIYKFGTIYYFEAKFHNFLIILGSLTFLITIKHILLHFLCKIVDNSFEIKFYQYWIILFSGLMSVIIIPPILMISVLNNEYVTYVVIFVAILLILLYFYRFLKALLHGRFYITKHLFHFFLYFCAVEIIPLFLVYSFLTPF